MKIVAILMMISFLFTGCALFREPTFEERAARKEKMLAFRECPKCGGRILKGLEYCCEKCEMCWHLCEYCDQWFEQEPGDYPWCPNEKCVKKAKRDGIIFILALPLLIPLGIFLHLGL